jgi:hypothetical protein
VQAEGVRVWKSGLLVVVEAFSRRREVTIPKFNATIAHALGLPREHFTLSPDRRPFTVADKGKPILELFA